ncbi:unnamed protein product [Callosobruchus maculatus]|uniref:Uncharacterized protein n=2 Tax=Callosobruchus maculatus TaxID=64391 RepID=A0A653BRQ3_CALMS|nr:unnamed protein product [Callosobruchus maculatus]
MLLLYCVPPLMKLLPRISPPKRWPKNWLPASRCFPALPPFITGKASWSRSMKSRCCLKPI